MNKFLVVLLTAAMGLGFAQSSVAEEKAAKPASCKEEAKNAGLTDKKAIKDFVKQCKKDRKAAK